MGGRGSNFVKWSTVSRFALNATPYGRPCTHTMNCKIYSWVIGYEVGSLRGVYYADTGDKDLWELTLTYKVIKMRKGGGTEDEGFFAGFFLALIVFLCIFSFPTFL